MQPKPTVFVVGKSAANRRPLVAMLQAAGCDVRDWDRGQDALDHLRNQAAHFVVLHSELRDMHWLTFLRLLRSDDSSFYLPLVLLTEPGMTLDPKENELLANYRVDAVLPSESSVEALQSVFQDMLGEDRRRTDCEEKLAEAKQLYRKGLLDAARRVYEEIVKDNETDLVARAGLMYTGKQDQAEYMKQLQYVLESDPENYNFKFELLQYYITVNDMERFTKLFDEVMAEISKSDEPYWLSQLGEVCLSLKLLPFCEKIVECMLRSKVTTRAWEPYLLKARTVLAIGAIQEAQNWVVKAEAHGGAERPEVLNLRGIIRRKQGDDGEALALFEKAASLAQGDHRLAFNIALCYRNLRQEQQAIASLQRAIALCPTYKRAHEMLERMQAH